MIRGVANKQLLLAFFLILLGQGEASITERLDIADVKCLFEFSSNVPIAENTPGVELNATEVAL